MNNGFLGMVRQWQEFFYDNRYHATPLVSPDFVKLAEAFGIRACECPAPGCDSRRGSGAQTPGPFLINFNVE